MPEHFFRDPAAQPPQYDGRGWPYYMTLRENLYVCALCGAEVQAYQWNTHTGGTGTQPSCPRYAPQYQQAPVYQPAPTPQAAVCECASCGQPIYVGQRVTLINDGILNIENGQPVIGHHPEVEGPALVHADCSAEYAHDYITKEPCEASDEKDICAYCDSKLNGDGE